MDFYAHGVLFTAERYGRVAVVRFKEDLLKNLTSLSAKERLLGFFDDIEKDESIRVVLIFGAPRRIDQEESLRFYSRFAIKEASLGDLERLCNAVNQFVMRVARFKKMVVHAGRGVVAPVFFNMGFACDWRVVGDDTVFQNPCLKLGIIPKGGGVLFFQRLMGRGKTADLLYSGKELNAHEALDLGLVNLVVPSLLLEEEALRVAEEFSRKSLKALMGIKRLLSYPIEELSNFLEHENEVIKNSFINLT